jgi:hypothetical protein
MESRACLHEDQSWGASIEASGDYIEKKSQLLLDEERGRVSCGDEG